MDDNQQLQEKLDLILEYKNNIKQSISDKGQEITDDMSTYADKIKEIVDYTDTISPDEYQECLQLSNQIIG